MTISEGGPRAALFVWRYGKLRLEFTPSENKNRGIRMDVALNDYKELKLQLDGLVRRI